jgi:hypothetical protein
LSPPSPSSSRRYRPVLAAAFTVGLVIAGHFGADLKNFEQVESAPVAWAAAPSTTLPNLAPFDVRGFVHAQPIAPSYVGLTRAMACWGAADAGIALVSERLRGGRLPIAPILLAVGTLFAAAVGLGCIDQLSPPTPGANKCSTSTRRSRGARLSYDLLAADVYRSAPCSTSAGPKVTAQERNNELLTRCSTWRPASTISA